MQIAPAQSFHILAFWVGAFAAATAGAQSTAPTTQPVDQPAFPATWCGLWKGPVHSTSPGGEPVVGAMELLIAPTDNPNRFAWQISYISSQERQTRGYELVILDPSTGRYAIDERNSVILYSYFVENTLYQMFTIQEVQVLGSYRLEGEQLLVDMVRVDPKRPRASGGERGAPACVTLPIRNVQRAVLRREQP
ncbi:MAG: hypothetical protein ACREJC_19265 [Tepidisphaeraceae bacterium]